MDRGKRASSAAAVQHHEVIVIDDDESDAQPAASAEQTQWKPATIAAFTPVPPLPPLLPTSSSQPKGAPQHASRTSASSSSTAQQARALPKPVSSSTTTTSSSLPATTATAATATAVQKMLTETEWTERILARSKVGPLANFTFARTISVQFIQLHKIGMRELQAIVPNGTPSKQQFLIAEQMVSRIALAFLQVPKPTRRSKLVSRGIAPLSLSTEENVLKFIFHTVSKQLLFLMKNTGGQDEEEFCLCQHAAGSLLDIHRVISYVNAGKYFEGKEYPEEALREFDAHMRRLWTCPPQHLLIQANRYLVMMEDVMDEVFLMLECTANGYNSILASSGSQFQAALAAATAETLNAAPATRKKRLVDLGLDSGAGEEKRLRASLKTLESDTDTLKQRINNLVQQLKGKIADPLANLQV